MLIKNIRIIDALIDFEGDVRIDQGKIVEIGQGLQNEIEVYDYVGQKVCLLPAFTDLHVHFRDPGFTYKEDVKTGSRAAIYGGFTAVNLMPNTYPVVNTLEEARDVETRVAEVGLVHANQTLSMTKDLQGQDYEYLKSLKKGEVLFVTDDGRGVNDDRVMEEIFKACKEKEIVIMAHEEDSRYSTTDMRKAENSMTFRDLALCEKLNGRIHFCHVSTIESVEAIAKAKAKGLAVTCEVTPHHIFATGEQTNHYRVNPPMREQKDVEALIKAIQEGVVDAIATDHAPHSPEDKQNGAPGMAGLEIAFSLCYTALVKSGKIDMKRLVELMADTPSKMMKLNKGRMAIGMEADLVIVEVEHPYQIKADSFFSKSHNTPFDGWTVYGKVLQTIKAGKFLDYGTTKGDI